MGKIPEIWSGACHCGAVCFEFDAPVQPVVYLCNCSICAKSAYLHLIVPMNRFRLLKGADMLTTYTFNTGVARHIFCRRCGVKSFYVPRSNPDCYSINVRCLDAGLLTNPNVIPFDGQNWEAASAQHGTLVGEARPSQK